MNLNKIKKGVVLLISYPLYPISLLIPKIKTKWLFGSFGKFNDNSRYLFEYCVENEKEISSYWVAKNRQEYLFVRKSGLPVIYKYSLVGLFHLLTSKVYIYSSYVNNISYFSSGGKLLVNLWHGIPLKKVEFDISTPPLVKYFNNANFMMKALYPHHHKREDLLLCPGEYLYNNIFRTAFRADIKKIINADYPRFSFIKKNINQISNEVLTITYAPTWRDNNPDFIEEKMELFSELDKLAENKKFNFNIKLHSNSNLDRVVFTRFKNINIIDNTVDPIELLLATDCLITDYSSIYFDFLFLNKPIIFFQYDSDKYFKNRECYSNKISELPGYICSNDLELIKLLSSGVDGNKHKAERENLIRLITSKNDNKYIINKIKERAL
ncbi:CDP-glycerol glycerophosphotransferase family protein [Providencia rettgeri]|uniref:CDP-glycerol glycerophosphotransferase family protein n=1 Tax=Providencia TaxID=586 RepID=UPI00226ECC8A|nr:CDP-glycerol glycerophosphotransferase family protein [Providencia rettgeri]MCX9109975.1 CDP-glycerol glycerophosphotransferase family protein [Providencia rettgeri]